MISYQYQSQASILTDLSFCHFPCDRPGHQVHDKTKPQSDHQTELPYNGPNFSSRDLFKHSITSLRGQGSPPIKHYLLCRDATRLDLLDENAEFAAVLAAQPDHAEPKGAVLSFVQVDHFYRPTLAADLDGLLEIFARFGGG